MNADWAMIFLTRAVISDSDFSPMFVFALVILGCAASRFSAKRREKKEQEKNKNKKIR